LVEDYFDEFEEVDEEHFAAKHGFRRPVIRHGLQTAPATIPRKTAAKPFLQSSLFIAGIL